MAAVWGGSACVRAALALACSGVGVGIAGEGEGSAIFLQDVALFGGRGRSGREGAACIQGAGRRKVSCSFVRAGDFLEKENIARRFTRAKALSSAVVDDYSPVEGGAGSNAKQNEAANWDDAEEDSEVAEARRLQERFGSDFLNFVCTSGLVVAQLSLGNGSNAKLLVDEARITSFRPKMWHGGVEEALFAAANDSGMGGARLAGGVVPVFQSVEDEPASCNPKWRVVEASSDPQQWVQVVLEEVEGASIRPSWMSCGLSCRITVVLSQTSLGMVLTVKNVSSETRSFMAACASHISVNSADGSYLAGLVDSNYFVGPREASVQKIVGGGAWWDSLGWRTQAGKNEEVDKRTVSTKRIVEKAEASSKEVSDKTIPEGRSFERSNATFADFEKVSTSTRWSSESMRHGEEYARLTAPVERLYNAAPLAVTLLDRGKRRAFQVDRRGFEDLVVNVWGAESNLMARDRVVCLTSSVAREGVTLQPGQEWEALHLVQNRGASDS